MASDSSIQDIHICGGCRASFNDITKFIQHKKECYHSSAGIQSHKQEVPYETRQYIPHSHTDGFDLQLPICISHDGYSFPSVSLGNHVETQEILQPSHIDEVQLCLPLTGSLDVPQYSYTLSSQQKNSDVTATYSYSWSSDQETQSEAVQTISDQGITCTDPAEESDHIESKRKTESIVFSNVSHPDHGDIATDNIAVYVVSPKSFASSVSNGQPKLHQNTKNLSDCNSGSLWIGQHAVSGHHSQILDEYSKITLIGKDVATRPCANFETSAHLNELYSCPQDSINGTKIPILNSLYIDSALTPNSENSTPCPEDLEVGQISASMIGQKNQQGELRTLFGSDAEQIASTVAHSHITSTIHFTSAASHTVNKIVNSVASSGTGYIRENTASAPLIKVKECQDNLMAKNIRRVSVEKRERLQGVSDDLLSSSFTTGTIMPGQDKDSKGFVQASTSSNSDTNMPAGHGTLTATAPARTSYKAVFTSPLIVSHRLTPTLQGTTKSNTFATTTSALGLQTVKRQLQLVNSKTISSNSVIYRDISASVKGKNETPALIPSKHQSDMILSKKSVERQILFEGQDSAVESVKIELNGQQVQTPPDYLKRSNCHTVVTNLDDVQLSLSSSSAILENNPLVSSPKTDVCIIDQNQESGESIDLHTGNSNFILEDGAAGQDLHYFEEPLNHVLHLNGENHSTLVVEDPSKSEVSSTIFQKREIKEQPHITNVNNSSMFMVYKNSGGNFILLPNNTYTKRSVPEPEAGFQPAEINAVASAKSSETSVDQGQYILKQTPQIVQHETQNPESSICLVQPNDSAESDHQQHYFIQNLLHSGATTFSAPSNLIPNSSGNTFITSASGTFIVSRAVSTNIGSSINSIKDASKDNAVKKPALKGGLLNAEREKFILKPRKRRKSTHALPLALPASETSTPGCPAISHNYSTIEVPINNTMKKEEEHERKMMKIFKCEQYNCNYSTTLFKDFQRHYRRHTGERPYQCPICKKSFNRSDKLTIHQRSHTGTKPYRCKICDYAAKEGGSLKKHMRIHTDERPFKCQICSYASRNSSQLIVHLRTHTGDSPFHCTTCSAKFKINSDLKRHMRVHTGEKPYQCDKCDYKSSNKGNLKTHVRINHSKENEIHCSKCEFVTSSKKRLREHIKTHDTKGALKCSQCDFSCSDPNSLRNHAAIHNTVKCYRCKFCPYSSKVSGNLKKHMQNLHMEKLKLSRHVKNSGVVVDSSAVGNNAKIYSSTSRENVLLPLAEQYSSKRQRGNMAKYKKLHICPECGSSFMREDSLKCHMKQHNPDKGLAVSTDNSLHSQPQKVSKTPQNNPLPNSSATQSRQSIQQIADAASKMYEEHYCAAEASNNSNSGALTLSSHHTATMAATDSAAWVSISPKYTASDYSVSSKAFCVKSCESYNSSYVDKHKHKHAQSVPWEHRAYTLSLNSSHESSEPQGSVPRINMSQNRHPKHPPQSTKDNGVHTHQRNPALQQSLSPMKRKKVEKSSPSPAAASYQITESQQQQPVAACVNHDLTGVSGLLPPLVLSQQNVDNSPVDSSLYGNIQLISPVPALPQDTSQLTAITQELIRQLSMQSFAQVQPSTHIQIVLPGATVPNSTQMVSETCQALASQQQIVLQVQGGADQAEVITIPLSSLNTSLDGIGQLTTQMLNQFTSQTSGQSGLQSYSRDSSSQSAGQLQIVAGHDEKEEQPGSQLLNKSVVTSMTSNPTQDVIVSKLIATSGICQIQESLSCDRDLQDSRLVSPLDSIS